MNNPYLEGFNDLLNLNAVLLEQHVILTHVFVHIMRDIASADVQIPQKIISCKKFVAASNYLEGASSYTI